MQIQGEDCHVLISLQILTTHCHCQDRGAGQHRGREVQPRQCPCWEAAQLSGRELPERMLQGKIYLLYKSKKFHTLFVT